MPNIRQQEKRVRTPARQRLENLRYRSTIKTLAKRLETAVSDGDADAIAVGARRARADDRQGCGSRRDSQEHSRPQEVAGRARSSPAAPSGLQAGSSGPFAAEIEQRPLQLEIRREPRAALEREVELGEPDDRGAQLIVRELLGLA